MLPRAGTLQVPGVGTFFPRRISTGTFGLTLSSDRYFGAYFWGTTGALQVLYKYFGGCPAVCALTHRCVCVAQKVAMVFGVGP